MGNHSITMHYGAATSSLEVTEAGIEVNLASPHVLGPRFETICTASSPAVEKCGYHILQNGHLRYGAALFPFEKDLIEVARTAYANLFQVLGSSKLYRVWHYVPDINNHRDGVEIYRLFCKGRSLAFEDNFHESATSQMCAASAVGVGCGQLAVIFAAGEDPAVHIENPEQTPAYNYPPDYGPRPPSFSRATLTQSSPAQFFLAGTASIKGHQSLHVGDCREQTRTTLENMSLVFARAGIHPGSQPASATGKIYLRNRIDAPAVLESVETQFPFLKGNLICIEADICRRELDVEIEATVQLA